MIKMLHHHKSTFLFSYIPFLGMSWYLLSRKEGSSCGRHMTKAVIYSLCFANIKIHFQEGKNERRIKGQGLVVAT